MLKPFHDAISAGAARTTDMNKWRDNHLRAILAPSGPERPLVRMLHGWYEYAQVHQDRFQSKIGEDYVLGPQWEAIGDALRTLLNGECGRLDCGTVDAFLLNTMGENGVDVDQK